MARKSILSAKPKTSGKKSMKEAEPLSTQSSWSKGQKASSKPKSKK